MDDWIAGLREHARSALRPVEGRLQIEGLAGEVEVLTDSWGVPHVYASGLDDLYVAQGYLHAAERLWQIDFTRRLAQGRLAEVVGEPGVAMDRFFRTIGLGRAARALAGRLDDRSRAIGRAYLAGFRAAVRSLPRPVEYQILAVEPETATSEDEGLVDAVSMSLAISFLLSTNWPFEVLRAQLARRLGAERASELAPFSGGEGPLATTQSRAFPGVARELLEAVAAAGGARPGTGSNNWVVAGSKSATGKPILCNDPHLAVQMPAIWYEIHLSCPEMEASGVSLPGIPGVVIGNNRRIAWGFTNTQADCEDLYLERLSADGLTYEFEGEWRRVERIREEILVRGEAAARIHEVRATHHGPLLTDLIVGAADPQVREGAIAEPLALRWIHFDLVPDQSAIEALDRAGSWEEFRAAARRWPAAGQNMVYADVDGNIGYQFTGTLPIRAKGSGAAPLPGWDGEHEWRGTVPFDELPSVLNPPQGFIATANHRVVDLDYPHYVTNDWEPSHRIRRIVRLLTEKERLDPDDMARIQRDVHSGIADDLVDLFLEADAGDGLTADALKEVKRWDRSLDPGSVGGAVFNVWLYKVSEELFGEKLGADLFDSYHRLKGWVTAWAYDAIRDILRRPQAFWVGGGGDNVGARRALLGRALGRACADLEARLGPDVSEWRWGRLHQVHFEHVIARAVPALAPLLSAGPFEAPGGDDTVNRGVFTPGEDYRDAAVSSWRQIVDLGDFDRTLRVVTVGQSGNPASPHFRDQCEMWLRGEYRRAPFTRAAVEAASEGRLVLAPPG
ncbi:MAG: penicillin acylase family protein [Acidobacteria bacterium]|nr:penicillin acylase family protein [Acidobacteriota bacterium]